MFTDNNKMQGIPDPLAPDHIKKTDAFGLTVATHIASEWFSGGYISGVNSYQDRVKYIQDLRAYYRGEQDIEKYKKWFSKNADDLTMAENMDFKNINYAEKFCNIVINGIQDDFYRLDIRSVDKLSSLNKRKKFIEHKTNQMSKEFFENAKNELGIDMTPDFMPESDEEILLYQEIKERPEVEIGEEINIDFVKKTSRWESIKYELDRDLINIGINVVRCWIDINDGVKIEYIDPEKFGHSYCNRNDFSDVYYYFYVQSLTINDLKRESKFLEKDLRDIAAKYGNQNKVYIDFESCDIKDILAMKVDVMRYAYKSSKEIAFKKHYNENKEAWKLSQRDSKWENKGNPNSKVSKILDTWYEGNYIIGSNQYVYGWRECENLAKDNMNKALPPFVVRATNIYKNKLQSFLGNIVPLLDQLQYQSLKIQHLYRELKPDLIQIDVDSLADLTDEGKGENKTAIWATALSILDMKGVIVTKRVDMGDMGIKDGSPARPIPQQQGSALSILLNVFATYYNQVREVTGVNPARDGSISANSLVGVNQMMLLASNTATKHIVDAATMLDKSICENISSSIKTVYMFDETGNIKKIYEDAIGSQNVNALEPYKGRHLHEFGFSVEMIPDKEMLNELKQDLSLAIQEGTIDLSEKYQILDLAKTTYKKAYEYMRFIRNRRQKQKMQEQQATMQMQTQGNIQSAQAAEEAKAKAYQQKKMIDLDFEKQMAQIRLMELQGKIEAETPKDQREFEQDIYLEKIKNLNMSSLAEYKETAKDERTKLQATQQSKLLVERNKEKPNAIDFKNEDAYEVNPFSLD
nr:hypothetical protein [uncultured Flavobacterium sp.]